MRKKKFGIIGAGTVGTLMAVGLESSGLYQCAGVHTRSRESYERFCSYVPYSMPDQAGRPGREGLPDQTERPDQAEQPGQIGFYSLEELARQCSLIFITTPDDAIAQVARALNEAIYAGGSEMAGKVDEGKADEADKDKDDGAGEDGVWTIIHCSGALPWRVMDFGECFREETCCRYVGVHPYRAFASIAAGIDSMRGTRFGVDGSDEVAVACGQDIVRALGGNSYRIPEDGKTLYHAAAVITSNYLVALASMGAELLEGIGLTTQESLELLLPLMQGTLDNLNKGGIEVLTGPIARGDAEVVRRHLAELPEEMHEVYCSMGRQALKLGRRQKERAGGAYAEEVESELNRLLRMPEIKY